MTTKYRQNESPEFGAAMATMREPDEGYPGVAHDFETIRQQRDELLAALQECITDDGAFCMVSATDEGKWRRRIASINATARAAIAKAKGTA